MAQSSKIRVSDVAEMLMGAVPIAYPLALKRTLLVLFLASFSATIVDSFGRRADEN